MYLDGLPDDSATRSHRTGGWTATEELLAQVVEEVSILAADKRREEPREVPRPYKDHMGRLLAAPGQKQKSSGHRQMLAAAARRGMVRRG